MRDALLLCRSKAASNSGQVLVAGDGGRPFALADALWTREVPRPPAVRDIYPVFEFSQPRVDLRSLGAARPAARECHETQGHGRHAPHALAFRGSTEQRLEHRPLPGLPGVVPEGELVGAHSAASAHHDVDRVEPELERRRLRLLRLLVQTIASR